MKLGVRACFLLALLPGSAAWRAGAPQPRSSLLATARRRAVPLLCDSGSESLDQAGLFASLRARQQTLEDELSERWREAKCASKVPIALTDSWVRRVAVSWPQVAIGTADGSVVLADLSTGEELSRTVGPHPAHVEGPESARDMKLLHGDYDGGGLTALAFDADHVVSAGREGGCVLWRASALASASAFASAFASASASALAPALAPAPASAPASASASASAPASTSASASAPPSTSGAPVPTVSSGRWRR